jgi:hypothetical protein
MDKGGLIMKKAKIGEPEAVLLLDILEMLKHNDYEVLRENGFDIEYEDGILEPCMEGLIDDFCKPIIEHGGDIEIILED